MGTHAEAAVLPGGDAIVASSSPASAAPAHDAHMTVLPPLSDGAYHPERHLHSRSDVVVHSRATSSPAPPHDRHGEHTSTPTPPVPWWCCAS